MIPITIITISFIFLFVLALLGKIGVNKLNSSPQPKVRYQNWR